MRSRMCIAVLCLAAAVAAQEIVELHPSPTANWLRAIDCRGDNCIAVGEAGSILTSADHGLTWTYRPEAANRDDSLTCVVFYSTAEPLNAWALRPRAVLYTSDAGLSWGRWSVPELDAMELLGAHSLGDGTVIVVGMDGLIVKLTANDGAAPTAVTIPSGTTNWLCDAFMFNDSTYYVVGPLGTVQWTTDDGQTWQTPTSGVPSSARLNTVWFADTNTGWVGGDVGMMLRTDDGGDTWVSQATNVFSDICDIAFASKDTGWAVGGEFFGYPGSILHTTDGGTTWIEREAPPGNQLLAMHMLNRDTVVAVGAGGATYRTDDGGMSWTSLVENNDAALFGLCFVDTLYGWAVGERSKILHTTDGGQGWTAQAAPEAFWLEGVSFVDRAKGWAAGSGGRIISTSNGGADWTLQSSTVTNYLFDICFVNERHGWAVGDDGVIVHTSNGGVDWSAQTSNCASGLNGVSFCDSATGWAVGFNGSVLKTLDGGVTWSEVQTPPGTELESLYDVECVSRDTAWVSGCWVIMVTTDGGASWTQVTSGNGIGSICCVGIAPLGARAWASTSGGFLYYTDNSGSDWSVLEGPSWNGLFAIELVGERHLWAAGAFGTIVFMQPDAATSVHEPLFDRTAQVPAEGTLPRYRFGDGAIIVELGDFVNAVLLEANGRVVTRCTPSRNTPTTWTLPRRLSGFYVLTLTRADGSMVSRPLVIQR
ncbi:MAG: hypothetical protein GF331_14230 [Chitinivibrionales bacterium]|nr:hypothetical protein [Chitinivibrionales bacterium]